MVEVGEDLGLAGVALAPGPVPHELDVEAVLVVRALDIAAGAGITVPEPRPADTGGRLEQPHRQAESPHQMQHVQAREASADDEDIYVAARVLSAPTGSRRSRRLNRGGGVLASHDWPPG